MSCSGLRRFKKLVNIWSSRGLSVYRRVTVIKSLIIPKFVYIIFVTSAGSKRNTVWNNKEIRINNKPIFYQTLLENGIAFVSDLLFETDTANSFKIINFLAKQAKLTF